ncbi:hypothetical protein RHMOL_Rhmol05G0037600 [Rhododendron molle]|uniref:Uncharacterized protein n=1 Tax=Rhododendron molle TaxID=49168 RepID=A0ACC0NL43_RHOML|nr:hypothetical protein RHMOL_Rhmol05G0037600 [Rhododendron molle]
MSTDTDIILLMCSETFKERKRLQFPTNIGHFCFMSSCTRVLCLLRSYYVGSCYSYAIILWNPSINKFKILLKPGGIGFVPKTNDQCFQIGTRIVYHFFHLYSSYRARYVSCILRYVCWKSRTFYCVVG